jgi:spore germination cell wall hydrolase CwlJ-like protein
MNVYHEARSENMMGKYAVAQVVMNRVEHDRFPDTVCEVVTQRRSAELHRCQFSWYCDGKADRPRNDRAWAEAQLIARDVLAGIVPDITDGALFYHADYVSPYWAVEFTETVAYGTHIFYRY